MGFGKKMKKLILILLLHFTIQAASAETIYVKYRSDPVDTSNGFFKELTLKPSSLIKRLIYDEKNAYLLVKLQNTFYHYCGIPSSAVNAWSTAPSLGTYYSLNIKGRFDCRVFPVPDYQTKTKKLSEYTKND